MEAASRLGTIPPHQLVDARLELHHAAQLVSIAVGRALLPAREDDSHTALRWLEDRDQWQGEEVPSTGGVRVGLRPADLLLTVGDADEPIASRLALGGRTRAEALDWLRLRLAERGVEPSLVKLDFHFAMPPHPVERGAAWRQDLEAERAELALYFSVASKLLREVVRDVPDARILTWPHHFDIGTLLPHPRGTDRLIGLGMSPGDEAYAEPYFYCSPYPRPDPTELPPLAVGHWHREGFFSAVLTASELLGGRGAVENARQYLDSALAACRQLLDR